jgi:hypothetical protein
LSGLPRSDGISGSTPRRPPRRAWELDLASEQCITGIIGTDRDALTALAFGLARTWDPEYVWIEFDEAILTIRSPLEKLVKARTPSDRWHTFSTMEDLGPDEANARSTADSPRTDAPPPAADDGARLYFSRLPYPLRRLARELGEMRRQVTVVLANMDRIANLYPDDPDSSRRYFRAAMGRTVSLVVTFCGPLRRNRGSADVVLLPEGRPDEPWKDQTVRVERADIGPFARDGTSFRIGDVPFTNELLEASVRRAAARSRTQPEPQRRS